MLDFPNSPTLGQLFTSRALTWRWDGTKWVAATLATGLFFPNKLLNPFMEIDQANEGVATAAISNNFRYPVDGVRFSAGTTQSYTGQRVTDAPPGYPNSARATVTVAAAVAAGDYAFFQIPIEADDLADTGFGTASARTVSVAFWLKASIAGAYGAALQNAAANRSYVWPITVPTANTWTLYTQTVPGDTAGTWVISGNAMGAALVITAASGSTFQTASTLSWQAGNLIAPTGMTNTIPSTGGATFQLGPAGLWVAPAPQPLLRTSIQAELTRCQRYYEKSYDVGTAPGTAAGTSSAGLVLWGITVNNITTASNIQPYKVTKRANPTITMYSGTTGASGKVRDAIQNVDVTPTVALGGLNQFSFFVNPSTAGININIQSQWTADARL